MNITIRIESFRLSHFVNIVFHPVTPEANENGRQCTRHDNQRLLAASRQTKSYQNERNSETVQV